MHNPARWICANPSQTAYIRHQACVVFGFVHNWGPRVNKPAAFGETRFAVYKRAFSYIFACSILNSCALAPRIILHSAVPELSRDTGLNTFIDNNTGSKEFMLIMYELMVSKRWWGKSRVWEGGGEKIN